MNITLQTIPYAHGGFLHVTVTELPDGSSTVAYQEYDSAGNPVTEPEQI